MEVNFQNYLDDALERVRKEEIMKIKKGDAGYIKKHKVVSVIKTLLMFGVVMALIFLGIAATGTKLNLLTLVAILGCLPASKALVETIMIMPHRSIKPEMAEAIKNISAHVTVAYDLVFTSEKQIMRVDSIVISDNTVCGYASNPKVNTDFAERHIKKILYANQFTDVTVKIFKDYKDFSGRVIDLDSIAMMRTSDHKEKEERIKSVILNISL